MQTIGYCIQTVISYWSVPQVCHMIATKCRTKENRLEKTHSRMRIGLAAPFAISWHDPSLDLAGWNWPKVACKQAQGRRNTWKLIRVTNVKLLQQLRRQQKWLILILTRPKSRAWEILGAIRCCKQTFAWVVSWHRAIIDFRYLRSKAETMQFDFRHLHRWVVLILAQKKEVASEAQILAGLCETKPPEEMWVPGICNTSAVWETIAWRWLMRDIRETWNSQR